MLAYPLYALMSLTLVIAILMPEAEHVRSDIFHYGQKGQPMNGVRQYCGRSLSNTLEIICGSVYYSRFKKSNQEMGKNDYVAYSYDLYPYKSIQNARKLIRFRRNSRGINEECCLKSCTTEELRSYCGAR